MKNKKTIKIDKKELRDLLAENDHLKIQVLDLQIMGTQLVDANRKLKETINRLLDNK